MLGIEGHWWWDVRVASSDPCLEIFMSLYKPLPSSVSGICDLPLATTEHSQSDSMLDDTRPCAVIRLTLETPCWIDEVCKGSLNSRVLSGPRSRGKFPADSQQETKAFSSTTVSKLILRTRVSLGMDSTVKPPDKKAAPTPTWLLPSEILSRGQVRLCIDFWLTATRR